MWIANQPCLKPMTLPKTAHSITMTNRFLIRFSNREGLRIQHGTVSNHITTELVLGQDSSRDRPSDNRCGRVQVGLC